MVAVRLEIQEGVGDVADGDRSRPGASGSSRSGPGAAAGACG